MASWTLLLMENPLANSGGSGQIGELTKATSRQLSFTIAGDTSLSFAMPGRHQQTAQIIPLISDVLAIRSVSDPITGAETSRVVQRFRVVSRQLDKAGGVLTASFSAVSYKALLGAWILHDTDVRSWATSTEQTAIAWSILAEGQSKAAGSLGITRGHQPTTPVMRIYGPTTSTDGTTTTTTPYFPAGKTRLEAIQDLADNQGGFEWDIEPDPAAPYTAMVFNAWNVVDGGRNQHAPDISDLVLDDGGSVAGYSHTVTPSDYADVVRFSGGGDGTVTLNPAWYPTTQDPTETPPEGRWERDLSDTDLVDQNTINTRSSAAYTTAHDYVPELTVNLRRGRWQGPDQLWLGDRARVIITEAVEDISDPSPGNLNDWIVYIGGAGDPPAKVAQLDVTVDDLGAEDVSITLDRSMSTTISEVKGILSRLRKLERR